MPYASALFPARPRAQYLRRFLPLALASAACAQQTPAAKETSPAKTASSPGTPEGAQAPRALPERDELPLVLRETLSTSMDRHGEELTYLLASVVLLHYEEAEELAELLANEPKLGRPSPGDTESLNALLPEAFFVHQSQLSERAKVLAAAARAKDDAGLVKAFGALAETCVGCHSSYLHDPLDLKPKGEQTP